MQDLTFRFRGRILTAFQGLNAANRDRVLAMQIARMTPEDLEAWAQDAEAIAKMQQGKQAKRTADRSARN